MNLNQISIGDRYSYETEQYQRRLLKEELRNEILEELRNEPSNTLFGMPMPELRRLIAAYRNSGDDITTHLKHAVEVFGLRQAIDTQERQIAALLEGTKQ